MAGTSERLPATCCAPVTNTNERRHLIELSAAAADLDRWSACVCARTMTSPGLCARRVWAPLVALERRHIGGGGGGGAHKKRRHRNHFISSARVGTCAMSGAVRRRAPHSAAHIAQRWHANWPLIRLLRRASSEPSQRASSTDARARDHTRATFPARCVSLARGERKLWERARACSHPTICVSAAKIHTHAHAATSAPGDTFCTRCG